MTTPIDKIPFHVDVSRIIEVLAKQIYQSPLALLRENMQNAFDAILLRQSLGQSFSPRIEVSIARDKIIISDNGIGMTRQELTNHYWRAGSSGKNTPEARAAGVVGTFGIGAMANFGIASDLTVLTESARLPERTRCYAQRSSLSAIEDCIEIETLEPTSSPGTVVEAIIAPNSAVDIGQALEYVRTFVSYLPVPVVVNEVLVSQQEVESSLRKPDASWAHFEQERNLSSDLKARVSMAVSKGGDVWITITNMIYANAEMKGRLVLRQGKNQIQTFRNGFGLANVALASDYQWGGIADMFAINPTAGREALTTESTQLLQTIVALLDIYVSETLGTLPECDSNAGFMAWAARHARWDLCSHLRVTTHPGSALTLGEVRDRSSAKQMNYYRGSDPLIIESSSSEESPLLVLSPRNPRQKCQLSFLSANCSVQEISDRPQVTSFLPSSSWTVAQSALAFRIVNILEADYFLEARVAYGTITHGVTLLVAKEQGSPQIVLAQNASHLSSLLELYGTDYRAFGAMAKDYVRNVIFPKIADLVPSSTREGAQAFLRTIRKTRERFEYEAGDLKSLSQVWGDFIKGRLSMAEAARMSGELQRRSVQVVDGASSRSVRQVIPDVLENENSLREWHLLPEDVVLDALPPITRREVPCEAKVLTIAEEEEPVRGYRSFIAIADGVREERGDFFLQPHRTSIVWGGQKVFFVFEHHSGRFGFYYELQMPGPISIAAGGRRFPTSTIVLKDRTYIPIPTEIKRDFIPSGNEKKRLEVGGDLLYVEQD